ncbi:asparagine synthase-related protein [Brucella sp. NBRC 12950]|uniref:asparagine synthetase B family protein n=1 Tax=Brucella sp. NBRC 12950 TaxID=2994518 RepID=UPI002556C504|nr:asparagine synthase-related protein [Brucella sp. NBRC 12950]
MCGFSAIVGPRKHGEIASMLSAIQHRGPDEQSIIRQGNFAVGVCRLCVIGDHHGHQPYKRSGTNQYSVLNGEIYNFRELQRYLKFVPEPAKYSDTALLSELFWQTGLEYFPEIDGMFTVLFFDRHHVWLARDAVGIKPLYLHRCPRNRSIRIASEVKGILVCPGVIPHMNLQTVSELEVVGFQIGEATIFEGITAIPPGSVWRICRRTLNMKRVCDFENNAAPQSNDDKDQQLLNAMKTSVRRQIRGVDNPLLSLSGGLDSTILAHIGNDILNHPLQAVIASPAADHPDTVAAMRLVTAGLALPNIARLTISNVLNSLPEAIWVEEIPSGLSAIPMLFVAKVASQLGSKVILSGEGADELFCGYSQYTFDPRSIENLRNNIRFLKGFGFGSGQLDEVVEIVSSSSNSRDFIMRMRKLYLGGQLQWNHLALTDRYFMSVGVECRVPYLGADVQSFCSTLRSDDFINPSTLEQKVILKRIAIRLGGPAAQAAKRKKLGFPSAVQHIVDNAIKSCLRHYRPNYGHDIQRIKPLTGLDALVWDIHHDIFMRNGGRKPGRNLLCELLESGLPSRFKGIGYSFVSS